MNLCFPSFVMKMATFCMPLHGLFFMHPSVARPILSRQYQKTHAPYCPFRPKNLKTYCCNMFGWFEEVGGTRKNHTHRCVSSFYYLAERKVRKTTKIIFEFLTLVIRHRFFFFVPETLNPIFLENPKRRAPENDRDLSFQKLIWSHMMPFGVNSDPSFRAQKQRI